MSFFMDNVTCLTMRALMSEQYEPIRAASCCPAFLVSIAGPRLAVAGAVFADKLMSQILTDDIRIGPSTARRDFNTAILRLAHVLRALKHGLDNIDVYYSELKPRPAPASSTPTSWTRRTTPTSSVSRSQQRVHTVTASATSDPFFPGPHFVEFTNKQGPATLTYKRRLMPNDISKAVFKADMTSNGETKPVVVKFTDRYCEQAHRHLAEYGLAPELHYCKKESSVADLWVVVMSYVDSALGGDQKRIVEDVERAISLLHDRGFVFGDLRRPNILHVRGGGAMLVDFDWCGKVGEARYPLNIHLGLEWAEGTDPNEVIQVAHDKFMLDRWKKSL